LSEPVDILLRRLKSIMSLSDRDQEIIAGLPMEVKTFADGTDIVREGQRTEHCFTVLEGLAGSYKFTGDGNRQIPSLYVPGDVPDLTSLHLSHMDTGYRVLTRATLGFMPHRAIHEACSMSYGVTGVLWRVTLIDAAIFREWLTNIGQRSTIARLAHIFCEMYVRYEAVGLVDGDTYSLPLTQQELGDAIGTSTVHVNRVVQELRGRKLIHWADGRLKVLNMMDLIEVGDFDPAYLHLSHASPKAVSE